MGLGTLLEIKVFIKVTRRYFNTYTTSKGRFPLGVFFLADEKTKEKKLAERKKVEQCSTFF